MLLRTRKWFSFVEHHLDQAHEQSIPLRKVAVAAIVENPYAGRKVDDLQPMIAASEELGREMGKLLLETFGPYDVQSYGKAGIAGLAGEQEHANANVEIGRFKGLGEMMAHQLKETTMDRKKRTLLQVKIVETDRKATAKSVERLMGNKAEARFEFIQERAELASDEMLDV